MGFRANPGTAILTTGIALGLFWIFVPLNNPFKKMPIAQILGIIAALTYLSGAVLIIWKNMKKENLPHHLIRIIYTISSLVVFIFVMIAAIQHGFNLGCVIMALPALLLFVLIWLPDEEFFSGRD